MFLSFSFFVLDHSLLLPVKASALLFVQKVAMVKGGVFVVGATKNVFQLAHL